MSRRACKSTAAERRTAISAARGALQTLHSAGKLASDVDRQALAMLQTAEGMARSALASLEAVHRSAAKAERSTSPPSRKENAAAAESHAEAAPGKKSHRRGRRTRRGPVVDGGGEDEDDVRIMLALANNMRADELDADQLPSDLEFILVDKAKIGSDILHRVQNAKPRGGIMMYAEVYRWFTETSGLGLGAVRSTYEPKDGGEGGGHPWSH